MEQPSTILPEKPWGWDKAPAKLSLQKLKQDHTARAWILNLIELIHSASFPLGFWVVHYMFMNAPKLAAHLDGDFSRVFFLLLGLLSQIYGGGISGNMMHEYEGWQVAPFRNPLALPDAPTPTEVAQLRVPDYNNAWLRAVAYQMLFTFQAFGLSCFSLASFGFQPWTIALVVGGALVSLLGPRMPRPTLPNAKSDRPVLPLSWSLLVVFVVQLVVSLAAYVHLFYAPFLAGLSPWLGRLPALLKPLLVGVVCIIPPMVVGAGGAIEGAIAESTFNQWWHFTAFVVLVAGLLIHLPAYHQLITSAPI